MEDKGGRPPSENPKTKTRQIRLTPDQDAYIAEKAQEAGMGFAEYIRSKVLPKRLRD